MAVKGRQISGWLNLVLAVGLALVAWALVTVMSTQPAFKTLWDLSPQARFSVEESTTDLLAELRESGQKLEIHTVFYPLEGLPRSTAEQRHWVGIQERIQSLTRDLLRQYAYLGGDAVSVTHHDLRREPAQIREVMREVQNGRYNSVIVKLGNRSKVLSLDLHMAVVDSGANVPEGAPGSEQRLPTLRDYKGEEALSSAIKGLLVEGVPKVYFLEGYSRLSTDPIAGAFSEFAQALADDGFELGLLDLASTGRVPEDATVVALIDPTRELPPRDADLLYTWVRSGGRLVVNPVFYPRELSGFSVSLRSLGEKLGFKLSDDMVCHLLRDPANPNNWTSGDPQVQNIIATGLNTAHPVTRPLARQRRFPRFKAAREITAVDVPTEGVRVDTSFVRTEMWAWLEAQPMDFVAPRDQASFGSRCVAAVIDVDPDAGERPGHVVVIAGQGFDNLTFEFNGDFALNVFNWLASREALISVRGQRYVSRKLELTLSQLSRIGWLLIGGVPGVLLLLGISVFWRRRRT